MRCNLFISIFVCVFFLQLVLIDHSLASNAGTQREIENITAKIKLKLPLLADEETEFTSINAGDMLLTFTYTLLKYKASELDKGVFEREIQREIPSAACLEMKDLLEKGVSARYKYLSKDGEVLSDSYIHKSDCLPENQAVNRYNVFRGDGFSFRYPLNWDIGSSQAETTKAFVRANVEQTGYSANCNINTSVVGGTERLTQKQINDLNWKIHDLKKMSKIKELFSDAQVINYDLKTYLSNQPASSIEFLATIKGHNISTKQQFFQIMTIRKPTRFVITCRSAVEDVKSFIPDRDLIILSFLITSELSY